MALGDDPRAFPLWARLTLAFLVTLIWSAAYIGQLWNRPGPPAVLNAAFIIVVGSVFSHEVMRAVARGLRRALADAERDE